MTRSEYNKLTLLEKLEYQRENIIRFPLQYGSDFIKNQTPFSLNFNGIEGCDLYNALHTRISVTGKEPVVKMSLIAKRKFSVYSSRNRRLDGFRFGHILTEFEELEFCII